MLRSDLLAAWTGQQRFQEQQAAAGARALERATGLEVLSTKCCKSSSGLTSQSVAVARATQPRRRDVVLEDRDSTSRQDRAANCDELSYVRRSP